MYADPDSFKHAQSSCSGWKPKLFKYSYVYPNQKNGKTLPFILLENKNILGWRKYKANQLFGWLSESSLIIEKTISLICKHLNELESKFCKIFTSDERLLAMSPCFEAAPNGSTLPWVKPLPKNFQKTWLLSIIASIKNDTEGHHLRNQAIPTYQPLDVFGRGRNEINKKEEALWPYHFSICIENASYSKYFTEKITDCFASKTVPIYWGNPKIDEDFDQRGILAFPETSRNSLTIELYNKLLPHVENNYQKVLNLELPDDIIYKKIKRLLR